MKFKKRMKHIYPLHLKRLPQGVEEAWFYGGKKKSIHIVLSSETKTIVLSDDVMLVCNTPSRQINIDF